MATLMTSIMHLPQLLSDEFEISTSEARRIIAQGAAKINGEVVTDLDVDLDALGDIVKIEIGRTAIRNRPHEGIIDGE